MIFVNDMTDKGLISNIYNRSYHLQIFSSIHQVVFLFGRWFINRIFKILFILFILAVLAVLGLCCCTRAFSSYGERGLLFIVVCGLLVAVASHCGAWALGTQASVVVARRLSSCGSRAQLLRGMWDLHGPGLKPVSPALAGGFLTTVPPGKPP